MVMFLMWAWLLTASVRRLPQGSSLSAHERKTEASHILNVTGRRLTPACSLALTQSTLGNGGFLGRF